MDLLLRSALPLSVNLNRYATKVATHIKLLDYFYEVIKATSIQTRDSQGARNHALDTE